jgi:quinol monooxygenase YgiN
MRFKEGTRDAFLREMNALDIFRKSRAESGNISYDYFLPIDGEDTLIGLERWAHVDAFKAHLAGQTVESLNVIQAKYMLEMSPHLYEAADVEL